MAWEEGSVPDTDQNHKRVVVLVEFADFTRRHSLFDYYFDGLPTPETSKSIVERLGAHDVFERLTLGGAQGVERFHPQFNLSA